MDGDKVFEDGKACNRPFAVYSHWTYKFEIMDIKVYNCVCMEVA